MAETFAFHGTLVRHEDGTVIVIADTPEEARELLCQGVWEELHASGGETTFEWDGQPPQLI